MSVVIRPVALAELEEARAWSGLGPAAYRRRQMIRGIGRSVNGGM